MCFQLYKWQFCLETEDFFFEPLFKLDNWFLDRHFLNLLNRVGGALTSYSTIYLHGILWYLFGSDV